MKRTAIVALVVVASMVGVLRPAAATVAPDAPELTVTTELSGLALPWDVAVAPDGAVLVTQRAGGFVVRRPDGSVRTPSADLSDLVAVGETGLMGIAVDPAFSSNRRLYTCQGHGAGGVLADIRVVAWQAAADWSALTRTQELVTGIPADPLTPGRHAGCRIRIAADGRLLVGTGDRAYGPAPQDLTSLAGKSAWTASPASPPGQPLRGHRCPTRLSSPGAPQCPRPRDQARERADLVGRARQLQGR